MKTRLGRIGNSFGLLVPQELLTACGFGTEATITVRDKELIITPAPRRPREGWAEAARQMRELGDDVTPELQEWDEIADEWNATGWQWPGVTSDEKVWGLAGAAGPYRRVRDAQDAPVRCAVAG
jgi:antitoxin MazE